MQSNTTAAPTASITPVSLDKLNWGPVFDDAAFWESDLGKTELNKRLATQMDIKEQARKEWNETFERLWHTRTIAKFLARLTERNEYNSTLRLEFKLERRESTGQFWDDPLRSWIYWKAMAVRAWCYLRGKNPNRLHSDLATMLRYELDKRRGWHSALNKIRCKGASGRCSCSYYVGTISVWHKGVESLIPDEVLIEKRKPWSDQNKVLLYDSGIGTGKTIELAASAYSRDAPITFLLDAEGDIKESINIQERHSLARNKLKASLDACVVQSKRVINTISQSVAFWNHETDDNEDVTVILGIDNASKCPNLVRAIIHQYRVFGNVLGAYIMNECEGELPNDEVQSNLKVAFSIAGAGVHNFAVGSIPYHYECRTPTVLAAKKQLYGHLLQMCPGKGRWPTPEYDETAEHPLLHSIANNPRMLSIFLDLLSPRDYFFKDKNDHERIVWSVLHKFLCCGSMKELLQDPETRIQMASQTLATLLFQREFTMTGTADEIARVATSLEYGIQFATFEKNTIPMHRLVEDFGLVTPVPFPSLETVCGRAPRPNKEYTIRVPQPFQVDKAMELLCIWLVQRGKTLDHPRFRHDMWPMAFEALAPQLISCAIGGAMTVAQEDRKDAKSILMDTLNMYVSPTSIDHADSEGEELWDGLRGVIPVSVVSDLAMKCTYFHTCPMRFSRVNEDDSDGYDSESSTEGAQRQPPTDLISSGEATTSANMEDRQVRDDSDRRSRNDLVINKVVGDSLLNLRAACSNIPATSFCPPLTTVIQEDGDFIDGSVSFVGGKRDANGQLKDLQVYTICTIAKRFFCARDQDLPDICVKKLRMTDNVLDVLFGKNRWYCVMSRKETCPAEQPIHGPDQPLLVSFPVDRSPMLSEYMTMLDDTWNPHALREKHCITTTRADLKRRLASEGEIEEGSAGKSGRERRIRGCYTSCEDSR